MRTKPKGITRQSAVDAIRSSAGERFQVEFIKRSNGDLRKMVARFGHADDLALIKGGPKAYNAADYSLIVVMDLEANGFRSIPIEGITRLKMGKKWERVT